MKILVVSDLYPPTVVGGYERRCAATVAGLERNHDVQILTTGRESQPATHETATITRNLPLADARGWRGAIVAPLLASSAIQRTREVYRTFRPDLTYVWNGAQLPQSALRAIENEGGSVAYSVAEHWYSVLYRSDHFTRYLLPKQPSQTSKALAIAMRSLNASRHGITFTDRTNVAVCWNSNAMHDMASPPDCHNIIYETVVHPASPFERIFKSVKRNEPTSDCPTILYVGRLVHEKGPDIAIDALIRLYRDHNVRARLVLIGGGNPNYEAELRDRTRSNGLTELVAFSGRMSPESIADAYQTASAVVIPSRWEEPFGLVCLEAALARVPVVAARSGGLTEILDDHSMALFFDRGDVTGCAHALSDVLTRPAQARERVERARLRADTFSFAYYMNKQEHFVEQAALCLSPRSR
jgi:glycogen(starch) synthase